MGITSDKLFENIYNVLFSPKEFFEGEDLKVSLRLGIAVAAITGALIQLAKDVFSGNIDGFFYVFPLIGHTLVAIIVWFFAGVFFEYTAKIFGRDGQLSKILFFLAFSSIPYILFPPLDLLKNSSDFGFCIASLTQFVLYLRIIYLYAYSVKTAYEITLARAFMFLLLPLASLFFTLYWSVYFFSRIRYIFAL